MLKKFIKRIYLYFKHLAPNHYVFNWIFSCSNFKRGNGRLPLPLSSPNANINDFIFHRMISNSWTLLQQVCVDKEYAKRLFDHLDGLHCPATIAVCSIDQTAEFSDFARWIQPYLGQRLIVKPTHSSGNVLFLHREISDEELHAFFLKAQENFFHYARETQYAQLERKIIVEANICPPGREDINDYKFFCIGGQATYLQIDVGRFADHKRAVMRLPEFEMIDVRFAHDMPDQVNRPECLAEMIRLAEQVSDPFDFVRVDLYEIEGRVYFGECTFSPGAGADAISNRAWGREFLDKVQASRLTPTWRAGRPAANGTKFTKIAGLLEASADRNCCHKQR